VFKNINISVLQIFNGVLDLFSRELFSLGPKRIIESTMKQQ